MNFRQLESFLQVSKLKSFSKAADQLYLTQPTISAHISQLEKELGVDLLRRTTKSISLTKNGQKLFGYAKEIVDLKNQILDEFCPDQKIDTIIKISASTIPFQYILPVLLTEYQKKFDHCNFELSESNSNQVLFALNTHQADIGFTGKLPDSDEFDHIPVCNDKLVLVTQNNARYQSLKQSEAGLDAFLKDSFIFREQGSGTRICSEQFLIENNVNPSRLHIVATMDNLEAIRNSCINGLGISFMSELSVKNELEAGKLLAFTFPNAHLNRKIYMVWPKSKHQSKLIKQFSSVLNNL